MPDQSCPPHECRCEVCKEALMDGMKALFKAKVKIVEFPSKQIPGGILLKASVSMIAEWLVTKEAKEANRAATEAAKGRLKEILWREFHKL